ncbi:hypothetical protein HanRHA438_Chr03g0122021 [Helianthus annuus]|nr:hypothetical protein HanIR_Chr03g0120001 [Helianthus annuus]KAJ0607962.1 hypothetical protein HanHA89_Chr03g0103311 [Helianthus annuus]KAJ0773813.1 hypothetical protein HanOQP8_Chr03g0104621 [Helianthus annuus]KAJ0935655.1 hypothetical protein HanRHA438_Chr03g0122021 [Helianthus annuus]
MDPLYFFFSHSSFTTLEKHSCSSLSLLSPPPRSLLSSTKSHPFPIRPFIVHSKNPSGLPHVFSVDSYVEEFYNHKTLASSSYDSDSRQ